MPGARPPGARRAWCAGAQPLGTNESRRGRLNGPRPRLRRTTRAARLISGSRSIVLTIHSTYDGSTAATSPRVKPANLPNLSRVSSACGIVGRSASSVGPRRRSVGPVGVEARGGSRPPAERGRGGNPGSGLRSSGRNVELRGLSNALVSMRAVTGRPECDHVLRPELPGPLPRVRSAAVPPSPPPVVPPSAPPSAAAPSPLAARAAASR